MKIRVSLIALVAAALPALPARAHHHAGIQPGARMNSPGGCTMSFVFSDDDGALHIGTAGHCVGHVGQPVEVDFVGEIGTVAWIAASPADFALVRIHPGLYDRVNPSMRHWGGPLGVALRDEILPGFPMYQYGRGTLFGETELTRPRAGTVTLVGICGYNSTVPVLFGDSGSPTMLADGRALGVVSFIPGAALHAGTRFDCALQQAAARGLNLTLVTAPLADPAAREFARAEHGAL